jgi:hypothetical protein
MITSMADFILSVSPSGAIRGLDNLHGLHGQARPGKPRTERPSDGAIGMDRLGPPAQYRGIAGFQAQTGRVRGHVGP